MKSRIDIDIDIDIDLITEIAFVVVNGNEYIMDT